MEDQYWSLWFSKQFTSFIKQNNFIKEISGSYFRRAKILVMRIPYDVVFISSLQSWEAFWLLVNHSNHTPCGHSCLQKQFIPFQNYQTIKSRYLLLFKISFKNYESSSLLQRIQDFLVFASSSFQQFLPLVNSNQFVSAFKYMITALSILKRSHEYKQISASKVLYRAG